MVFSQNAARRAANFLGSVTLVLPFSQDLDPVLPFVILPFPSRLKILWMRYTHSAMAVINANGSLRAYEIDSHFTVGIHMPAQISLIFVIPRVQEGKRGRAKRGRKQMWDFRYTSSTRREMGLLEAPKTLDFRQIENKNLERNFILPLRYNENLIIS